MIFAGSYMYTDVKPNIWSQDLNGFLHVNLIGISLDFC